MRKLVIGILVFALISVGVTGVLIRMQNNKIGIADDGIFSNVSGDKTPNDNLADTIPEMSKEKTIDLYGTYDENDLVIEDVIEKVELATMNVELKIPKVKGLKNKSIEEKVNNDIKTRIVEKLEEIAKNNISEVSSYTETSFSYSNFSNVISYLWHISYKTDNDSEGEYIALNYELVNGESLKFEDLFVENADMHSIVRKMLYRDIARSTIGNEVDGEVYYDDETGKWMYDTWDFESEKEIKKEYKPFKTENDINKQIKAIMSNENKIFYFTPTKIYLIENNNTYSYYLYFKDIAKDVVIYDKYLTEESLYETNNIGLKNLWTCSKPLSRFYMNYGFLEKNLYYDISIDNNSYIRTTDYPFEKSLSKIQTNLIEECKEKLERYRKIAKENPDKFFVLGINSHCDVDSSEYNSLISTRANEYLTTTDISYKEDVMNELLESYRYYNLGFYNSALEYAGYTYDRSNNEYYEGNIVFDSFEKKVDNKIYDARTLKEITSIDEIFKNSDAHKIIVIEELKLELRRRKPELSIEEINSLVEEANFIIDAYGIDARVPEFDYEIFVMDYSEFNKSILTIYDLDMYVVSDSNTRKIEKSEIQNLSLDDLNRAYNEIFARYGHEFKNKELKEYFELCSWYTPIAGKSVSLEELNEIERYNLDIIKGLIAEKK